MNRRRSLFGVMKRRLVFALTLVICLAAASCRAEAYRDENLISSAGPAALYGGYIYYLSSGGPSLIYRREAGGAGPAEQEVFFDAARLDAEPEIKRITALAAEAEKGQIYFLYEVSDIYKRSVRLGKISLPGGCELDLLSGYEKTPPRSQYMRVCGGRIFVSGDGFYSPSECFPPYGGGAPLMLGIIGFAHGKVYGRSAGRFIITDTGSGEVSTLFSPDGFFDSYEPSAAIVPGAAAVSEDGTLYFSLENIAVSGGNPDRVYKISPGGDAEPSLVFEGYGDILRLEARAEGLYFCGSSGELRFYSFKKGKTELISVPDKVSDFTVFGGRIYINYSENGFSLSYPVSWRG